MTDQQIFAHIQNGEIKKAFVEIVQQMARVIIPQMKKPEESLKEPGIQRAAEMGGCMLTLAANLQKEGHRLIAAYAVANPPQMQQEDDDEAEKEGESS